MGFPKVKSFFGLSLRTGTLIIAGLSLVGNIVTFFFFLYTLVMDLRFMEVEFDKPLLRHDYLKTSFVLNNDTSSHNLSE